MQLNKTYNAQQQTLKELQQASLVIDNSPVVVFRWKAAEHWPIEYVSKNIIQFGYTEQELLSGDYSYSSIIHPDDLERVNHEVLQYSSQGAEKFKQEYRIVSPSGEIFWVDDRTIIERDAAGKITYYQGNIIDISTHKKLENKLKNSEKKSFELFQKLSEAQKIAHIGSWSFDLLKNNLFWSDEIYHIFGIDPKKFKASYEGFLDIIHPDDRNYVEQQYQKSVNENSAYNIEHRIIRKNDGQIRWVNERCKHHRDKNDNVISSNGTVQDITKRKQAEQNYQYLFDGTGTAMCVIDADGTLSLVNHKAAQFLETDIANIIGSTFLEWIAGTDKKRIMDYHLARLRGDKGLPETYEFQFVTKKGHISWAIVNLTFFSNTAKTLASILDISEIKRTEYALKEAIKSQHAIFAAVPDLMLELDANGQYLNVWLHKPKELVKKKKQLLGRTIYDVLAADVADQIMAALKEAAEKGHSFGQQVQVDTQDKKQWFELSVSLKDGDIIPNRFIVLSRNITDRKQMEEKLIYFSSHDPLTNLYNRHMLKKELAKDIQKADRYNHPLSLFMLDIDHFKVINDTYGHSIGDVVLTKLAMILQASTRETDYVVRYGGEEFVIVLPETPISRAIELAERLRSKVAQTNIEIKKGSKLTITVSIGVSNYTGAIDELFNSADSAMYAAKKSGRNCVRS